MTMDGGWRVWASFCRREDAIYTEWEAAGGEPRALGISDHRVINHGDISVYQGCAWRVAPRSIRTE